MGGGAWGGQWQTGTEMRELGKKKEKPIQEDGSEEEEAYRRTEQNVLFFFFASPSARLSFGCV